EFKQSSLAHAWPNSRVPIDPLTLGLTSLPPHAIVPSLLSDEGKRIVLPAFFQRGRDLPDRTRQTLATAHRLGPHLRRRGSIGITVSALGLKATSRADYICLWVRDPGRAKKTRRSHLR